MRRHLRITPAQSRRSSLRTPKSPNTTTKHDNTAKVFKQAVPAQFPSFPLATADVENNTCRERHALPNKHHDTSQ